MKKNIEELIHIGVLVSCTAVCILLSYQLRQKDVKIRELENKMIQVKIDYQSALDSCMKLNYIR